MSPLNIYKASAGSGKTFALTMEYLKLLFRSPGVHRHILAVTFTNKAAGEMKQRILGTLHKLSGYDGLTHMEEMERLMTDTGLDENEIRRKAGGLLKAILNDYTGFSVGTIDKFFQSVIRAFTREIGIQPGYNLELDHNRVLSLALERLFQDLTHQQELQHWLIRFAEERMEESRSWNFRNDMIQLGMQLFREAFQGLFIDQDLSVLEKENLDRYLGDLDAVEEATRENMTEIGERALEQMRYSGFQISDFRLKGNSPPGLFLEAFEGREVVFTRPKLDALIQPSKWLNKDASVELTMMTEQELMPLLNRLYQQQKVLNTLTAIRQNFYTLGILGDIWDHVKSYARERNLFLIADSSRFLRGIIGSNQVPFIYERTGNRYSHIMLDEFQDTSVFQYDNFRPLLDNALASGHNNLVVGDVKQSIYRWRNSDWNILATDLENDFQHQKVQKHSLKHNRRSREQIVRFNNTVFQLAPKLLAETIENELYGTAVTREEAEKEVLRFREAYADAVQQIPEHLLGSGGLVRVEVFEESEEKTFGEQVLSALPVWIKEIQHAGIAPGEIAILVRSRREGVLVANTLLEYARSSGEKQKFRLISNESLLLIHNAAVSLILSVLRYLVYPGDELNNANLKYGCYLAGIIKEMGPNELFDTGNSVEKFLPASFLSEMHLLKQRSLYELVESLISLFGLDQRTQDLPYLQALQDLILDLHRREPQGIADFLHYWEQHGSKKGISVSEESNAIRIITIHKAKGLEFKAVIVPFCNWEVTTDPRKTNLLWCNTRETPFNRLPVVPIRFSSKLEHTFFSRAYYQERMKGYMDNLNLMYVAFTRARDVLFIGFPDAESKSLRHTGDLLKAITDRKPASSPALDSIEAHRSGRGFSIGSWPQYEESLQEPDPWQFTSYPVNQRNRSLKIRMRSDEYFVDEDGAFRTGRMYGNVMHRVFSGISSARDVDPLLFTMQREGLLPARDLAGLREEIVAMITDPRVKRWFSEDNHQTIYNERSILCGAGMVLRPDRVIVEDNHATVVDFKFGEVEKDTYGEQIRKYMDELNKVGYSSVKGFLWYVVLGKVIEIDQI